MPADGEDVAALATRLRRGMGHADVLTDRRDLHRYECDGLAVHTLGRALVALRAVELGGRKASAVGATGAHVLVTAELLDASLRGTPYPWSPEARAPTHQGG